MGFACWQSLVSGFFHAIMNGGVHPNQVKKSFVGTEWQGRWNHRMILRFIDPFYYLETVELVPG